MVDWEGFYGSFRRPDFVQGYEIQNHLGGGAFGEVYKARKTSIGKSYAIKFLRLDEETNRDAIERELDQVRLFASIDHPNLVTIEDMGVVMDVPYLIMGYAGEDTLARHLKRADIDRDRAMRYFVQTCRGVLALHDRRLAHFDLKPSNVFIKGDVARVGDYGLAKLLAEGRQTLSFGRGTPHYMAPEMLKNRADHRADIYSLGVILFECFTFRVPFGEDTPMGMVVRETDEPPDFPEDFPDGLRPVVETCLRLEPEDRYSSVIELLEALGQTARQGDSVRIPDVGTPFEVGRPERAGAERADEGSGKSEDLRHAAAELARGAVGVARGVWTGVVERVQGAGKTDEGSGAEADVAGSPLLNEEGTSLGGDVVSVSTLDDPDATEIEEEEDRQLAVARAEKPWMQELQRTREAREAEEERNRGRGRELLVTTTGRAAPLDTVGTVPVPPRAEGGWLGNVLQSVIVGTEIMGALVTGPVLAGLRGAAAMFDRVVRGVPGVLGALIRLILLLLLMALLGALVSFIVLAAVSLRP